METGRIEVAGILLEVGITGLWRVQVWAEIKMIKEGRYVESGLPFSTQG